MSRAPTALASILALDLGSTCGWALRPDGRLESGVQVFDLKRGESPGMRFVRFSAWLALIVGLSPNGFGWGGVERRRSR